MWDQHTNLNLITEGELTINKVVNKTNKTKTQQKLAKRDRVTKTKDPKKKQKKKQLFQRSQLVE